MSMLPAGKSFPQYVRDAVLERHARGMSPAAIEADLGALGPRVRTIRAYIAVYRDEGRSEPLPHSNGHEPTLTPTEARDLYLFQLGDVACTNQQKQDFIRIAFGKHMSLSAISYEIVHRLGFTLKIIKNFSNQRIPAHRVDWYANSPWPQHGRPGCRGVRTSAMLDFDEKTLSYKDLLRMFGHSLKGTACTRAAPPPRSQRSYNCILAVDINVGVICYVIYRGTMDKDVLYAFLAVHLIPAIAGTGRRFVMCDNLSQHLADEIQALLNAHGHIIRPRAIHSPDHAPVEWCFSHATTYSHHYDAHLRAHPEDFARCFAAGLDTLSPAYLRRYFADAHYLVPGEPYKPYLGD
jgi:hypothetical protein